MSKEIETERLNAQAKRDQEEAENIRDREMENRAAKLKAAEAAENLKLAREQFGRRR